MRKLLTKTIPIATQWRRDLEHKLDSALNPIAPSATFVAQLKSRLSAARAPRPARLLIQKPPVAWAAISLAALVGVSLALAAGVRVAITLLAALGLFQQLKQGANTPIKLNT